MFFIFSQGSNPKSRIFFFLSKEPSIQMSVVQGIKSIKAFPKIKAQICNNRINFFFNMAIQTLLFPVFFWRILKYFL